MNVSKSILAFLKSKRAEHNGKDLLDFYLSQGTDLETQVNVAAGKGSPVPGRKSTYTDGLNEWWSIRIPKKADSVPEWNEYNLKWPLELHAEAIGSTGWNWRTRRSLYVGFDFDAITGHAKGVGITDDKLEEVKQAAMALPYVQVRRSTGGAGIHLYVFFEGEGIETDNHTEHAALGRCVLGLMGADSGFDFHGQIDACGGNMWLWHRKSTPENQGLQLLKASDPFPSAKLPSNWRDHVDVVTRKRSKIRVGGVEDGKYDSFEALASAHRVVPLSDQHKAHIDEIIREGFSAVWIPDHHLLQTHTVGFQRLMEKHKEEYGLQGFFETNAQGKDPHTPNMFAFPGDFGSWKIYRFSPGISEAKTWEQDGHGWTTCWFNRRPNLKMAARALGGRDMKKGGYEFDTLEQAAQVAAALGKPIEIEDKLKDRKAVVNKTKDGRLAIEVEKFKQDDRSIGFWNDSDKKGYWTQVFDCATEAVEEESIDLDDKVRALETPNNESAGWAVRKDNGEWSRRNSSSVKTILQSFGSAKSEAEVLMGLSERKSWKLVSLPFQPEYPGDRQWNLEAPQFAFAPATHREGTHATWDMILDHVGKELDPVIAKLDWACEANIRTGADYLRAWFACIFRDPFCRLPYLFLFGNENCGKSILWEAFNLLVTKGVVKADRALTSQNDFNGELAGALLCVVEEKDISKAPGASAKIKDAVTSLMLSIRKMRTDTYQVPNMTHWIQCANHQDACIVPPGDTRITVIYVNTITSEIPKPILMSRLKEEAPAFLRTLIDLPLPSIQGRLSLPVITTRHKARSEDLAKTPLEQFMAEQTYFVKGEMIEFKAFYDKFYDWLPGEERHHWSKIKVSRSLPVNHPSGAGTDNRKFVCNLSWEKKEPAPDAKLLIVVNGKIRRDDG